MCDGETEMILEIESLLCEDIELMSVRAVWKLVDEAVAY